MTVNIQKNHDLKAKMLNDNLKAKLVSSASYIHNMAKFKRNDNSKTQVIFGTVFYLIISIILTHYGNMTFELQLTTAIAALVGCITYVFLTGIDFNQFAAEFFNENQQAIEDSFYDGLKSIDELYADSSLANPIRVNGGDADIISFSKDTDFDRMIVYCVLKVEGVAIRVKKAVRLTVRGDGHQFGEVIVSDYKVSRLSDDDLVAEYKNNPDVYQQHFAL